MIIQFLP